MSATIDFDRIRSTVNLRSVIEADIGPPLRGGRWACPFHGGEHANLGVAPDRRHWRCWKCGLKGDVIDWVMNRHCLTIVEAVRQLGGLDVSERRPRKPVPAPRPVRVEQPASPSAWSDPEWQSTVDRFVCEAESALWRSQGRAARAWLAARGLQRHTIRRFRLGFVPDGFTSDPVAVLGLDRWERPRAIKVRRGITIPWVRPESWYSVVDDDFGSPGPRWVGCNVRRLPTGDLSGPVDAPKYFAVAGSERGHPYPWPDTFAPGVPVLLVEGEFDALLAWQEVGHIVNTATLGSASQNMRPDAFSALSACPDWLLLTDHDEAGDRAATKFMATSGERCRRLMLPDGKDLTEFVQRGGSVPQWLRSEWDRLGWGWPI